MRTDLVRKYIVFYGSVQGVGFRWRARNAADYFSCTGWVKNEWDGSVSMEIQGTEDNIGFVIHTIEQGTFVRVENMDIRNIPVVEDEYTFYSKQ